MTAAGTAEAHVMGMERPGKAVILLVAVDEESRDELRTALMKQGYSAVGVENEEEALVVTVQGGARPDLIIVSSNGSPDQLLDTGRRIRKLSELTPSVPIIVVPRTFDGAFGGTDVSASEYDYICYGSEPNQLEQLIGRLLG